MSLISPLHVAAEQFVRDKRPRYGQLFWFVPGLITATAIVAQETRIMNAAFLLAATSIMAGMTFTMTMTFWNKSLEARRDPAKALQADVLTTIDDNLNHLVWTVMVGVSATGLFALVAMFADPVKGAPVAISAVCAGALLYLITLVGVALQRFAEAALTLR